MPIGNVTGLSSGIDWSETVKLIMKIERQPLDLIELRRTTQQSQLTNWSAIEAKVKALQDQAQELDSVGEFLKKSGSSSDSAVLTVTADATAEAGTHTVIVNQLAVNAVHAHQTGWADPNSTAVNTSGGNLSFSYDYAGTTVTVVVPDGTTLQGLVNLVNRDVNNAGVSASIINDGTGGAAPYHLVLTGNDTGAGNGVTIIDTVGNPTDIGPTGAEFDEASWDITQAAQNAQLRVDGIPDAGWGFSWIESASNDVQDVIPGVTLHLLDDSAGNPIEIDISLDKGAITDNVSSLITAFNGVIDLINSTTRYDPEEETAGPLAGDSLARSLRNDLMNVIAENIPGTDTTDAYRSLGQVGLKLTSGGKLTLDSTALDDALDDDAKAVARLFAFDSVSTSSFITVSGHGENTVGGSYAFTVTYDAAGNIDPSGTNTIGGYDAIVHGDTLLGGATGTGVEGLLLTFSNPGGGPNSLSGTVKVYTGFATLLFNQIEDLTDSTDGTFQINRERLNDSIDLLDEQIASWETRLSQIEANYTRKFSAMETLISQLKTQSSYLTAAT